MSSDVYSKNRITENFLKLTAIDSESFNERKMADVIKDELKELGIVYSEDDAGSKIGGNAGNIYAYFEGNSAYEPILLSAHMDTVIPGNSKKAVLGEDGIIRSDGTTVLGSDDLAGITEILEGIRRVKESGKDHRSVEILFTVAEEAYTRGAAVFDYSKIKSKEAYCLDLSGDVGEAVNKAGTLISYRIKVIGKASHAGFEPEEGVNAIEIASKAIAKIKQGRVDDETTLNIGTIAGGSAKNIVPEECVINGEIRSYNHEKALSLYEELKNVFENESHTYNALIEADYTVHIKAYEVDKNEPLVKRFVKACNELELSGNIKSTLGGADNHQFNANGIKGLVLSCGMENVHTKDEYIKTDNLLAGAKLVEKLITDI